MATEIRVPTLGESVSEATVGTWFKKVGDTVKADEPILELETDKVTIEVPAPAAGVLSEIVANAGEEPSVIVNKVKEGTGSFGYNAATGQFGDMLEMGILDPTKVTRTALQNAASIAGLMITTEAMVAEAPKKDEPAMPPGGGMGGMGGMDF